MTTERGTSSGGSRRGRHAARLAAVQALYQMEITGDDNESVVRQFTEHRFAPNSGVDEEFFSDILRGVPKIQDEIDCAVRSELSAEWTLKRIDSTLRAILRAGVFELLARRDVPAKVVIDEYVEIAKAFFPGDEPGFANAALDKIAHRLRAREFGEVPADDAIDF